MTNLEIEELFQLVRGGPIEEFCRNLTDADLVVVNIDQRQFATDLKEIGYPGIWTRG